MVIKNREELVWSSLRARAVELIEAGIRRVLPRYLLQSTVKIKPRSKKLIIAGNIYDVSRGRVFVIGGGKASGLMAQELEHILKPDTITAGAVNCKADGCRTSKIAITWAGHPLPDEEGIKGVHRMLALKSYYGIDRDDVVICLISGGGSSLMPCPVAVVTLEDKRDITRLLIKCGTETREMNIVRKHLSLIKGGNLGSFYEPARVVSLIISNVAGDDVSTIASGPAAPDPSTFDDAYNVLEKYQLLDKAPGNVISYLNRGCRHLEAETPRALENCANHIIGNNMLALEAMAEKARDLGLKPLIVTAEQTGDTREVAALRANEFLQGKYKGFNALLIGGKTAHKMPENAGKGGRSQHFAAISLLAMEKCKSPWLFANVGTDGSDYLPDVAGAMVDDRTLETVHAMNIDVRDYVDRFDTNALFNRIGRSLIVTGPTGTDVGDIMLYLSG